MKKRKIKNEKTIDILSNQKGMALLTTLIFVFILVTFAVALLTMTSNDTKLSTLQRESTRAFYQADAGIEKALWYLNTPVEYGGEDKFIWRPTDYPNPGTNTEYYQFTIKDIGIDAPTATPPTKATDKIEITSVGTVKEGKYSAGKRTVVVTAIIGISPTSDVSYDHAIFTDNNMTLNGGISIDGSIHSNGAITNNGTFSLVNGSVTAVGDITNMEAFGGTSVGEDGRQNFPKIDWPHFESLAISADVDLNDAILGHYYGDDTTVVFNTDTDLYGIHFIDGDVKIQASLILNNATILATGTIDVIGSGDVYLKNDISPLALIAKGDITIGGSVHGEGIIQSGGKITINGVVNIEPGALYAIDGVLNGGGGTINVVYGTGWAGTPITGTGVEVYIKTSWREAY